jgi:hypothetical protein
LRRALDIVKQGRGALASGNVTTVDGYRMLAAFAYVSGFLEARGYDQLGAFLTTIPAPSTSTSSELDQFINRAEALLSGDTRMGPAAVAGWILIGAAGNALWDGVKWAASKL